MGRVDLHVHTNTSDGKYSPEEIVRRAAGLGITILAIADHDTVDGISPALKAARDFPELTLIPSVEISTDLPDGEAHVVGHFIDYTDTYLKSSLERFRHSRETRARKMIARLENLGIHIDWERVQQLAGEGSIGRPHIAEAMLEKGYISSFREAFAKYIGREGPAYVTRDKMTPAEAVQLVVRSGGLPVLAHPLTVPNPETIVADLKPAGLVGLEAYYDNYGIDEINRLVRLAEKQEIIAVGGSDYHGLDDSNETMMGAVDIPAENVERLIALANQKTRKTSNIE